MKSNMNDEAENDDILKEFGFDGFELKPKRAVRKSNIINKGRPSLPRQDIGKGNIKEYNM